MSSGNNTDNINEILHKRAEQLAKSIESSELVESSTILVFHVGNEQKYAIPYYPVQRVSKLEIIRSIPNLSALFMGVIYLNSVVWPVINGAELFNLVSKQSFNPEFLILMNKDDTKIALATNTVVGLVPYNKDKQLTQFENNHNGTHLIKGVYETDIALIDIDATFTLIKDYTP